jgi:chitodextrinase
MAECTARGIDYQPCVMPGDLSTRGVRRHGDFYWRHIYNMVRLGSQGLYVSMFDEYNEGNQIAKTAESAAWVPANSNIVPLDEDGTACSSDYYLRITADGGKMLKGLIPLTAIRPTQPIVGGQPPVESNLARGKATSASTTNGGFPSGNAVDGNAGSYWESVNNSFPQWLQVDLGAGSTISRVVLKLPPGWGARTQTLSIQGSTNGSTFTTLAASQGQVFNPATANTVTITFPATSARYVRLNVTANTGWPAAQCAEFEVYGTISTPPTDTQAPTAPSNLTVTAKTTNSVSLSWQPSTDNVAVTGYQVRQGSTVVATLTGTAHTVTGLNPNTSYSFTVTAQDAAGNTSPPSNTATTTTNPAPNANLALGKPATASSTTQNYGPGNAVDANSSSYWESANNAFPQWLQVDLGATTSFSRLVLKLPPASAWGTRTQTLSVQGSTNGSTFSTVAGSAGYTFNPATANTVTITFAATSQRYVRLNFTANTGWPAGQISEFEIYAS